MDFFQIIRKSIYDKVFYDRAKTENFSPALKQYTLLILFVAILTTLFLYVSFGSWSERRKDAENIRNDVLMTYPDELVLTFQNGRMTSNVAEPYSIPMPEQFYSAETKNLLVINTQEAITTFDFDRYQTQIILGGDAVWIRDTEKNKIEIQKFDAFSVPAFVINKGKVSDWTQYALKVGQTVATVILLFLPLLIFAFFWIGYLVYLLLGALIIWVVARLRKNPLSYGQAYKLGLYLLTLPIFYNVLTVGSLGTFRVPLAFTIILILVTYVNLAPKEKILIDSKEVDSTRN